MTGRMITCDHRVFDLPPLLSWTVEYSGGIPCDCYQVRCPYDPEMAEPLHLAAGFLAMENGKVMLRGMVDEYEINQDGDGLTMTLSGRGYAARLLDNESRPMTYQSATLEEIIRNHVTPYGISCEQVAPLRANSVYTVSSGVSQWTALENFCRSYGGFSPRFSKEGLLVAAPEQDDGKRLRIEDKDILAVSKRENHYGVLSEVLVIDKTRNVYYWVKNRDFMDRGGQCRRVVYTPGQSTYAAMRYTGEYQIARSAEEEVRVEVRLPGVFLAFPGDRVRLELSRCGLGGDYQVAEAANSLSREGEISTLTLKELK